MSEREVFETRLPRGVGQKGLAAFLAPILRNLRVKNVVIHGDGRVIVSLLPRSPTSLPPQDDIPIRRSLMERARSTTVTEIPFRGSMAETILRAYRAATQLNLYPICWATNTPPLGADGMETHPVHQTTHVFAGRPLYLEDTEGSLLLFAGPSDDGLDDVEQVFRIQPPPQGP